MKVLLTGASGNIGSSTLRELIQGGHTVRCLVRQHKGNETRVRQWAGHARVDIFWGDLQRSEDIAAAVQGQDVIIHLAFVIPPQVDEKPQLAYTINVEGTRRLLEAAARQERPPAVIFGSSLDVFGFTQHLPPPRRAVDPVQVTGNYSQQKITCEQLVQNSGLSWSIYRFSDVPPLSPRSPHPIMYRIPLDTRMEVLHTYDAGLAVANGLARDIWGKILLIGGGPGCQIRYRQYLQASLEMAGIGMLPEEAFGRDPYSTDWLDTTESQDLLAYQRHTFEELLQEIGAASGMTASRRKLMRLIRPLVRRQLLTLSPYYKVARAQSRQPMR